MVHKINEYWYDRYLKSVYKIKRHKTMDWHFLPSEKNDKNPQQAIRIYDNKKRFIRDWSRTNGPESDTG